MYKSGDQYSGFFMLDRMHGRGQYWFSGNKRSVLYVGEMADNCFQGLGKMIFVDDTVYYGSFVNNQMSSNRAVINYGNGDKYKGEVLQSKRYG